MSVCQTVLDSISEYKRRNVEGQLDLFGFSDMPENPKADSPSVAGVKLPDFDEYTKSELLNMEREVTGLFLSGHPLDEFRSEIKRQGAVNIGDILSDFARESGNANFSDNQLLTLAGVIESVRTKPTRNNSVMAYITLDDGSGIMELLAFARAIDQGGGYMEAGQLVLITGRLSARDEKEPQLIVNTIHPISDTRLNGASEPSENYSGSQTGESFSEKKLFVKLNSENAAEYKRLKLILTMFPGNEQLVAYFCDTKKTLGTKCIIHDSLIKELNEMLGEKNVVQK
jgi:DNA polymerase-3 subunit alpha